MLESPDGAVECLGELLPGCQTLWRMTSEAGPQRGGPLDQYLREEMLLRGEVGVQRAEGNVGFLRHILERDAVFLFSSQQEESRRDDALAAGQLIFRQYVRRHGFGHVSL